METSLSEYLRNRGLTLDPVEVQEGHDPILADENLVKEAAELWNAKKSLLTMVIQARVNAIAKYQLEKAIPEEVMVYRQALVELGALITDFEKYVGENSRRTTNTADNTEPRGEEPQPEPPEEGKEGSL